MNRTLTQHTTADEIISLERAALDRWGNGDPGGYLDVYAPDITYFDPLTPARVDGHQAMADYYRPWFGKIHVPRYELQNPKVVIDGDLALLTYNLVNYTHGPDGAETTGTCWNSTAVYRRRLGVWQSIHSHWSFTRHKAFHAMSAEASERQDA